MVIPHHSGYLGGIREAGRTKENVGKNLSPGFSGKEQARLCEQS